MTPAQLVAWDAMRSAYDEATVRRMERAAVGKYVQGEETWGDASYLAHAEDIRPRLIENTWLRIAESIARSLLAEGHFERTQESAQLGERGAGVRYRLRLPVL